MKRTLRTCLRRAGVTGGAVDMAPGCCMETRMERESTYM